MTDAEKLKREAEMEAYRLKKEAEMEAYKIKKEAEEVAMGKGAKEERYKNAVKAYVKFRKGLEDLRKKLNITIDNSEEYEYFPKYNPESFDGVYSEHIAKSTIKMKNLIIDLINENYLESWTKAIETAYEGTDEIETRINNLKTFIKMDPILTYDAMSVSTEFINRLEKTSHENRYKYINTLNGIKQFCANVPNADKVINLLDTVIYSKYDGVIDSVKSGIKKNPSTKSPENVDAYFRTVEAAKLKRVFAEREPE